MSVPKESIPPTLTILFDGMDREQIAAMLVEHFGAEAAQFLVFDLAAAAGVNIGTSVCTLDVLEALKENGNGDVELAYTGTPEQLVDAVWNVNWGKHIGDIGMYARDEVTEKLTEAGLIVPTEVPL